MSIFSLSVMPFLVCVCVCVCDRGVGRMIANGKESTAIFCGCCTRLTLLSPTRTPLSSEQRSKARLKWGLLFPPNSEYRSQALTLHGLERECQRDRNREKGPGEPSVQAGWGWRCLVVDMWVFVD